MGQALQGMQHLGQEASSFESQSLWHMVSCRSVASHIRNNGRILHGLYSKALPSREHRLQYNVSVSRTTDQKPRSLNEVAHLLWIQWRRHPTCLSHTTKNAIKGECGMVSVRRID